MITSFDYNVLNNPLFTGPFIPLKEKEKIPGCTTIDAIFDAWSRQNQEEAIEEWKKLIKQVDEIQPVEKKRDQFVYLSNYFFGIWESTFFEMCKKITSVTYRKYLRDMRLSEGLGWDEEIILKYELNIIKVLLSYNASYIREFPVKTLPLNGVYTRFFDCGLFSGTWAQVIKDHIQDLVNDWEENDELLMKIRNHRDNKKIASSKIFNLSLSHTKMRYVNAVIHTVSREKKKERRGYIRNIKESDLPWVEKAIMLFRDEIMEFQISTHYEINLSSAFKILREKEKYVLLDIISFLKREIIDPIKTNLLGGFTTKDVKKLEEAIKMHIKSMTKSKTELAHLDNMIIEGTWSFLDTFINVK